MKTLVELYDNDRLKNILAPLMFRPENIVYVCHDNQQIEEYQQEIIDFLEKKKVRSTILFKVIDTHNQEEVERLLRWITQNFTDIVFEITGGDDYLINAVGQFCIEHRISRIYKDFEDHQIVCIDGEGVASERPLALPKLLVNDVIKMSGGRIVGQNHGTVFGKNPKLDIVLLKICRLFIHDRINWHKRVAYLQKLDFNSYDHWVNSCKVVIDNKEVYPDIDFLHQLEEIGAIKELEICGKEFSFKYLNKEVETLLLEVGSCLEMYLYYILKYKCNFDDVAVSVKVEWTPKDNVPLLSETDLIILKDASPIFISCKTSLKSDPHLALYEIKVHSEVFGGGSNKAILVTSDSAKEKMPNLPYRAKMLGIEFIDIDILKDEEKLIDSLNSICNGV